MDSDILVILYWVIVVVAVVGSFVLGMFFYVWISDVLARHICPAVKSGRQTEG